MSVRYRDTFGCGGPRLPEDIAIVGYDNNTLAALEMINLSSVDQKTESLARAAVSTLLGRIDGRTTAEHRLITPCLVRRNSS